MLNFLNLHISCQFHIAKSIQQRINNPFFIFVILFHNFWYFSFLLKIRNFEVLVSISHIKIFSSKSMSNQKINSDTITEKRADNWCKSLQTQMELTIQFITHQPMIKLKSKLIVHLQSRHYSNDLDVIMTLKVFFPQLQINFFRYASVQSDQFVFHNNSTCF